MQRKICHSSNSTPASKQTCTATNTPARNASEGVIITRPSCDPLAQPNGETSVPRRDGETTVREVAGYALRQAGIWPGGRRSENYPLCAEVKTQHGPWSDRTGESDT